MCPGRVKYTKEGRQDATSTKSSRIVKRLSGYISTAEMDTLHKQLHLKVLSDRRKMLMLMLMYKLSLDVDNVDSYHPEISLRTRPKVKMKVPFTSKERVRRSPFYKCNQLWDKLDSSIQLSKSMLEFKMNLKKMGLGDL